LETQNGPGGPTQLTGDDAATGLEMKGVLAFIAGLLFPGAGHLVSRRWGRGLLLAAILVGVFFLGIILHGKLSTFDPSNRLSIFFVFADAGSGLLYLGCLLAHVGFELQAKNPTYEYGTSLLHLVGLLNYLVALDAYDIAVGRKP
jgi:drug/metabolite transporter (DMT)-like permease